MAFDNTKREIVNVTGAVIAFGLVAILGFVTWALINVEVPKENQNALLVVLGTLTANVGLIISFYFGSSSQNKKQADTIDKQADTIKNAQQALAPLGDGKVELQPGDKVEVKGVETTDPNKDTQ